MTRKIVLCSIVLSFFLFNIVAYALDFSSYAVIQNSGTKKYKAVRLTPAIYNGTRENLADLMLMSKDNETLPYFINSYVENVAETKKNYKMKLENSFVKDEYFYLDYSVEKIPAGDVTATSIELQTNSRDFAKQVELWGGYDNKNWELVKDDTIYDVGENKKLEISFNSVKKYTYYRFRLTNNLEKISFSSVALKYDSIIRIKDNFTDTITPGFTTEEKDKTTVVKLQGLKNLKLDSISVETDSMFKRNVRFESTRAKVLYNLSFKDTAYRDTTMPMNSYRVKSDSAELVIENRDDKPINISKVTARYIVDELVFDGSKGGDFILKFGNEETTVPKAYDIAGYKEYILKEGYDVLNIKTITTQNAPMVEKIKYGSKYIFNIVIVLAGVIMGIIIVLRLRKTSS